MENMELWNKFKTVPEEAKKPIKKGKLAGYTDINPQWRLKVLTEKFGPVGIGWYTEIVEKWTEPGANGETIFYVILNLYIKYDGEWSKPIQGTGGNKSVNQWSKRSESNDEALKMAETDAISVACKKLGIAADVYFEKDRSKYNLIDPDEDKKKQDGNSLRAEISKNEKKAVELKNEITGAQKKKILAMVNSKNKQVLINKTDIDEYILSKYKRNSITELLKTEASQVINYLNELVTNENKTEIKALLDLKGFTMDDVNKIVNKMTKVKDFRFISIGEYNIILKRLKDAKPKHQKNDNELPLTEQKFAQNTKHDLN